MCKITIKIEWKIHSAKLEFLFVAQTKKLGPTGIISWQLQVGFMCDESHLLARMIDAGMWQWETNASANHLLSLPFSEQFVCQVRFMWFWHII